MGHTLQPGLTFEFRYEVPEDKTVPYLFPDLPEGKAMPKVFATGFMVGLFEFTCIKAVNPFLDWPREMTVGTHINVSHLAATPPGMTITVRVKLEKVEGRKLSFSLEAFDEVDKISTGNHQRFIINTATFNESVTTKKNGSARPA
ncbi:MAG: thioesterase family protein [Pseudomonadota bacterium]